MALQSCTSIQGCRLTLTCITRHLLQLHFRGHKNARFMSSATNVSDLENSPADADNSDNVKLAIPKGRKIGITKVEQQKLMHEKLQQPFNPHTLKVAIIGSPNAGKSTLANKLIGWKIAPVSEKVHTTRKKTLGILTDANKQIIFLDTPGMIERSTMKKHLLEKTLLLDPHSSLFEADVVLTLVDISTSWGRQRLDTEVLKVLHFHPDKKAILVLNKVDLVKPKKKLLHATRLLTAGIVGGTKHSFTSKELEPKLDPETMMKKMSQKKEESINDHLPESNAEENVSVKSGESQSEIHEVTEATWNEYHKQLRRIERQLYDNDTKGWPRFDHVFMICAKDGSGVYDIKDYLMNAAKPGDWEYPVELITPQPTMELARQCIWEQCMNHLPKEIPYKVDIEVALWEFDDEGSLRTAFNIVCTGSRQMGYIMGKDGETIRKIARDSKQALLDTFRYDMSFKLWVKNREHRFGKR